MSSAPTPAPVPAPAPPTAATPPGERPRPRADRRLSALVVAFGVLVVAGGAFGALKGSVASLAAGGTLGLGIAVGGLFLLRGREAWFPTIALCFLTAVGMAQRLHATGKLVPSLPVGILAIALAYALVADRRRALGVRRPR